MNESMFFEDSEKETHFSVFGDASLAAVLSSALEALDYKIPSKVRPHILIDGTYTNDSWQGGGHTSLYIKAFFDHKKRINRIEVNGCFDCQSVFSNDFLSSVFNRFAGNFYILEMNEIKHLKKSTYSENLAKLTIQEYKGMIRFLPAYFHCSLKTHVDHTSYYPMGTSAITKQWLDYLNVKLEFEKTTGLGECIEKGCIPVLTPLQQYELFEETPKGKYEISCISHMLDFDDPVSEKPELKKVRLRNHLEGNNEQFSFEFKINPDQVETRKLKGITISIPPALDYLNNLLCYSLELDLSQFHWEVKSE